MGDECFDMVDTFLNADHIKVSRTTHLSLHDVDPVLLPLFKLRVAAPLFIRHMFA